MSGQPTSRPLASALAAFVVLCGLLLVWIDDDHDAADRFTASSSIELADDLDERLVDALEATQNARRAVDSANYGDVRGHLDIIERTLAATLAEMNSLPD